MEIFSTPADLEAKLQEIEAQHIKAGRLDTDALTKGRLAVVARIQEPQLNGIEYQGRRVVTPAMIDELHQVPDGSASESFRQNRKRFVEGEDFFTADSGAYLFSEAGYVKIIQPFDDDLSWRVHREFVNSYVRSRESGNEVQTAQQSSLDSILNDPTALRNALLNYTENEATAQLHLKVRELPAVDRDEIDKGLHEAELGRIAAELGLLAAGLEPDEAAVELKLRGEYISAERRLFLTRLERGRILAGYKAQIGRASCRERV